MSTDYEKTNQTCVYHVLTAPCSRLQFQTCEVRRRLSNQPVYLSPPGSGEERGRKEERSRTRGVNYRGTARRRRELASACSEVGTLQSALGYSYIPGSEDTKTTFYSIPLSTILRRTSRSIIKSPNLPLSPSYRDPVLSHCILLQSTLPRICELTGDWNSQQNVNH